MTLGDRKLDRKELHSGYVGLYPEKDVKEFIKFLEGHEMSLNLRQLRLLKNKVGEDLK